VREPASLNEAQFPEELDLEKVLESLWRIRLVEEAIAERYGEQEMRCPVHLSIGQEAAAVGVCVALRDSDPVFSTHRCHAHYLAKGGDLRAMIAEIYGKSTGCLGGRGGSMHLMDPSVGLMASVPIVASAVPLAVGAALAQKLDHGDSVAIAFLGDASVEEGVFHESANFARLRDLPVIFVCENNLYSVYTHLDRRQPRRPLVELVTGHHIPADRIDGNDVLAVHAATTRAVARARAGEGPSFLQLDTYRWREHCGPNFDNDIGYRSSEEYERWRRLCPVTRFSTQLRACGRIDETREKTLIEGIQAEIDDAFEFAKSSPLPDPSEATRHVYAEPGGAA